MTRRSSLLRRLRDSERGAALVEFAFTGPLFIMVLMGIFDYSWQMYAKQVLQGAVAKAARDATLEGNVASQTALDNIVSTAVTNVFPQAQVTFSRRAYDNFNEVGNPEPFNDDNGDHAYQNGECFEDVNGNGVWDSDRARGGNGGADDVILYTVRMRFNRVLPVWRMLGQPQETTLVETTVLRNQPFAVGVDASPVLCS
jgi:hypothetical protein